MLSVIVIVRNRKWLILKFKTNVFNVQDLVQKIRNLSEIAIATGHVYHSTEYFGHGKGGDAQSFLTLKASAFAEVVNQAPPEVVSLPLGHG